MKKVIGLCILAISFSATSFAQTSTKTTQHKTQHHQTKRTMYTCPMHPEVVKSKPGKCPKCGMALVKKEKKTAAMKM
ncbi:MAG: heavy metal-binding domain-containing protein [Ferruginibacter sp.]